MLFRSFCLLLLLALGGSAALHAALHLAASVLPLVVIALALSYVKLEPRRETQ